MAMQLSYKQVRLIRQIVGITFLAFAAYWMVAFVVVGLVFKKWW